MFEAIVKAASASRVHNGRTEHFRENDFMNPEDDHIRDPSKRRRLAQITVNSPLVQSLSVGPTVLGGCCELGVEARIEISIFLPVSDALESALEHEEENLWPHLATVVMPEGVDSFVSGFVSSRTTPGPADANVPVSIRTISFDIEYGFHPQQPFAVVPR